MSAQKLVAQIVSPFPSGYIVLTCKGEVKVFSSNKILISHSKGSMSVIHVR